MSSVISRGSWDHVDEVLAGIRSKGVRLWAENGQLRYQAPQGALTPPDLERLRTTKSQIVARLEQLAGTGAAAAGGRYIAPLSFSQLAYWNLFNLSERSSLRAIALAMRLRGPLKVDALRKSLAEIVRRHSSLRAQFILDNGTPMQRIAASADVVMAVADLTERSPDERESDVQGCIEQMILTPVRVADDPLFGARLLKLQTQEHVLILAADHLIADMSSMGTLWRELRDAYSQLASGCEPVWSNMPMQFADYARWQRRREEALRLAHGEYWKEQLGTAPRLRFPSDRADSSVTGWGHAPVHIDKHLKRDLGEWCRQHRTTIVLAVFTAYVAALLRWCQVAKGVVQYQSDGRSAPKLSDTVGFFASSLYIPVELQDDDTFIALLDRSTAAYCQAYEHADFSYLAAQSPTPAFTRNGVFNWVPMPKADSTSAQPASLQCSPIEFVHPLLKVLPQDHEPGVLLHESDEITGYIYFPLQRFSPELMDRFTQDFALLVNELLVRPAGRIKDVLASEL